MNVLTATEYNEALSILEDNIFADFDRTYDTNHLAVLNFKTDGTVSNFGITTKNQKVGTDNLFSVSLELSGDDRVENQVSKYLRDNSEFDKDISFDELFLEDDFYESSSDILTMVVDNIKKLYNYDFYLAKVNK